MKVNDVTGKKLTLSLANDSNAYPYLTPYRRFIYPSKFTLRIGLVLILFNLTLILTVCTLLEEILLLEYGMCAILQIPTYNLWSITQIG